MGLRQWLADHLPRVTPLPSPDDAWPQRAKERAESERMRQVLRAQIREVNDQLDRLRSPQRG